MSLLLPHLLKSPRRSQMLHTCVECGFATPRRRAYEKHLRACESARSASGRTLPDPPVCRNYRCHHCGSCTNKAKLFLYHLRDVHGENMSVFACDLCEYASRHKHKVFRHRKLVHKGAEPLSDLLPVDSEDSQETGVMAMDSDVIHNDVSMDNADDTYDAEDEDGRVVNGNSQLLVNENGEVIDESVLGVYVVNPEPVDDDIDLNEVNDSFIEHQESVTLNSRRQNAIASRGGPSSSKSENRFDQQQQHVMFKCRMCPYTNPYKWKIAQHARTIHMRKTMYRCAQCNFTCERKIEWCVHKTKHSKKAVHSCDECAYSTTMKRNFDRHMRRHSNGGPIKCSMCTYASTGEAAVQRHMAEFHPSAAAAAAAAGAGGNAVLKLANFVNISKSARSVKTKLEHASAASAAAAATTGTVKRLNHYQSFRAQGQGFLDNDNDEGRDSDQSMSIDIHTITDDIPAAHGGPALAHTVQYSCRFCQARFRDLFILKNHVFVKHGDEACSDNMHWNNSDKSQQDQPLDLSNKDTDCEWSTGDALDDDQPLDLSAQGQQGLEQLQGHVGLNQLIIGDMKYEAFDGPMKCAHCNYSASWPSDLQRHMMVHSLERRFRCHLCGRRYKHQFDLNAHLRRVHRVPAGRTAAQLPGISPTAGHILGALLNDRQSLTVLHKPNPAASPAAHRAGVVTSESAVEIRVAARKPSPVPGETGGEKLRCEFCNYVGKYRAEVERHMRLHTGDKPFACLFCPYRSFWKGDMKRHLVKHHPAEVHSCPDLKGMVNDTELLGQQRAKEDRVTDHQSAQSESVYQSLSPAGSSQLSFDDGDRQFDVKVTEDDVSEENTTSSDNIPSSSSPLVFTEKQVFKCTQCPFHCDAPSKLKCHAEIHANLKRFKCPECGKRSNWTWDIKKHIRKDHVDQTLEVIELSEEEARATLPLYVSTHRTCGRSGSESKESTPVREGVQRTTPAPAATAAAVASAADSVVVKETDAMIEGDKSLALLKPFKCSQCSKQSNWKWDIQKHIRAAHAESGGKVIVIKGNKAPLNRPLASRSSLGKALSDRAKAKAQQHLAMELGGSMSTSNSSRSLKPLSLQPSDLVRSASTERFRPFRCSECGKRSNWKWDLNKHIASYHSNEAHIVTMTEDEARDTFDEYLRQQQKEKGLNSSTGDDDMADFSDGNLEKHVANLNVAISLLSPQCDDSLQTTGSFHTPVTKTHHSKDAKKQKKFKCSVCEYRSNYRSDIQRHLKRRHSDDVDALVIELSDKEAAATLTEYRKVFGAKKFVSPDKSSTVLNGIYSAVAADEDANNSSENEDNSMSDDEVNNVSSDPNAVDVTPDTMGDGDNELWVKVTATESGAGSKGRGRHFCEWCPYVSINRNDYIYHKQFHRAKSSAAFKCDLCPYWVTQKRLLKQHEKVHQPQYKLRYYPTARLVAEPQVNEAVVQSSVTCSQAEPIDRQTENAEMEFESSEMYKCMRCPYTSASADRIVEHNARHGALSSEGGIRGDLSCNYCDYRAVSEESLSVHETVHAESYRSGVDVGSESEETVVPAEDGDGNYEDDEWKCDLCPFHTMQYTRFEKHLLLHRTTDNEVDCPSVPSDTATTANIGDALLLMNDNKCASDAGEGCSGAAIFPEHSLDEPDVTNVVTYDVNANVAEKIIVNSTATEMAEQVA